MKKGILLILSLFLLSLVCPSRTKGEDTGKSVPAPYTVFALKYGESLYPRKVSGKYKKVPFAWIFWVIRGRDRVILVDTGFSDEKMAKKWGISGFMRAEELIKKIDLTPGDITDVIITHAHWDHMGNLSPFTKAKVWIQKKEYDFATTLAVSGMDMYGGVNLEDVESLKKVEAEGRLKLVDGDTEILFGISVYMNVAHSPGLQFVVVETGAGKMVLASDTIYLYDDLHPAVHENPQLIIPGHEPAVFRKFEEVDEGVVDLTRPLRK